MEYLYLSQPSVSDRIWQLIQYPYNLIRSPMQTLLSIPALPFLLVPVFSSYSTSLNLLFFYLTWSTLVLSNSPLKIEFISTLIIRLIFYILPSIGFLFFDSAIPSIAVNMKEHGNVALALGDEQGGTKGRWWKVALVSVFNVLFGVALQAGIEYLFTELFHIRSALKVTTTLPMPFEVAKDLFRGFFLHEVLTYTLHYYVLHSKDSPAKEYHAAWQHSILAPYSLTAHYDHPLPYLIHMFLPAYIPSVLFRFHILTYNVYLALISLEETFAYSGYNVLPNGFMLGGIARRRERHLMGGGVGNFGCWGLCDFAMGSSLGSDVLDDASEETGKSRIGERAKGKGKPAGRKGRK